MNEYDFVKKRMVFEDEHGDEHERGANTMRDTDPKEHRHLHDDGVGVGVVYHHDARADA